MKGQYEQQCNAAALQLMGVPVIKSLKKKHIDTLKKWITTTQEIEVHYPNNTEAIINTIIKKHAFEKFDSPINLGNSIYSAKKLKEVTLQKILAKMGK